MTQPSDLEALVTCLVSLKATTTHGSFETLIVDDGSPVEELLDELEHEGNNLGLPFELLRKPENEGFSRTVNVGLRRALQQERDAVLVNADIEFRDEGWLERMQRQTNSDGEGLASVVGALLSYPHGLIQHGGIFFSVLTRGFDHVYKYAPENLPEAQHARVCPVTGALQFIRLEALEAIGVYDEKFRLGFEDVDYCIRVLESGRECVYQPTVRAWHFESMFRGRPSPKIEQWQAMSWFYFMEKWAGTSFARWCRPVA